MLGAASLCVLGVLVIVVASRATPSHPFTHISPGRLEPATSTPPPAKRSAAHFAEHSGHDSMLFVAIVFVLFAAAALLIVFLALRGLGRRSLRFRGLRRTRRVPPGRHVEPSLAATLAARAAVSDAVMQGGLDDVLERGPVSDAIITCWVAVESALRTSGVPVRSSDTSTELVERALASFGVRESALRSLSALYREARFSTHQLTEVHRERARRDLASIRQDLVGTSHAR